MSILWNTIMKKAMAKNYKKLLLVTQIFVGQICKIYINTLKK